MPQFDCPVVYAAMPSAKPGEAEPKVLKSRKMSARSFTEPVFIDSALSTTNVVTQRRRPGTEACFAPMWASRQVRCTLSLLSWCVLRGAHNLRLKKKSYVTHLQTRFMHATCAKNKVRDFRFFPHSTYAFLCGLVRCGVV